ncbi:MAG TPA: DUF3040 domain-containing protein [Jatrophihabitans sp.]|jgi:hypothetical protein
MPLSDHEQRLLDEIEQALYAEDPKFVSSVRSARARSTRRRALIWGSIGTLVGLGLVLVGLIASIVPLSVVGFVLVVGSIGFAVQSLRHPDTSTGPHSLHHPAGRKGGRPAAKVGFRTRMTQRLQRRFDEGY